MSQKHYIALAAAFAAIRPDDLPERRRQWKDDLDAVASVLANDNPRFDRARFLATAGA